MCPYYDKAVGGESGLASVPIEICRVNGEPLTQDMINRMCRNNCNTCSEYRRKSGTTRMPQQSQNGGRTRSSSGAGGIVVIIIVVAVVTKLLGIW